MQDAFQPHRTRGRIYIHAINKDFATEATAGLTSSAAIEALEARLGEGKALGAIMFDQDNKSFFVTEPFRLANPDLDLKSVLAGFMSKDAEAAVAEAAKAIPAATRERAYISPEQRVFVYVPQVSVDKTDDGKFVPARRESGHVKYEGKRLSQDLAMTFGAKSQWVPTHWDAANGIMGLWALDKREVATSPDLQKWVAERQTPEAIERTKAAQAFSDNDLARIGKTQQAARGLDESGMLRQSAAELAKLGTTGFERKLHSAAVTEVGFFKYKASLEQQLERYQSDVADRTKSLERYMDQLADAQGGPKARGDMITQVGGALKPKFNEAELKLITEQKQALGLIKAPGSRRDDLSLNQLVQATEEGLRTVKRVFTLKYPGVDFDAKMLEVGEKLKADRAEQRGGQTAGAAASTKPSETAKAAAAKLGAMSTQSA